MSVKVLSKVWEHYPNGGSLLLAILALADWSDDNGLSFPSIAALAKKTRLSKSQVRRVVHDLINADFVRVVGNKNGGVKGASRRYKINLSLLTASADVTPSMDATASADARDGLHGCAETASAHASLIINEPSLTIKDVNFPEWLPLAEWNAYVDFRKKIKKPLTPYAMKLAINKLQSLVEIGHPADAVINEAILRGWLSFYPPKTNPSSNSQIMEGVI